MRILIIEDEPDLVRALEQAVREAGYAVDTAVDGEEGLWKARSWEYDALVLDIMLPGRDGWSVLQELRRENKLPVLMLTARDDVSDRVRGLDLGADDYLVKPFSVSELLARLRALIRRAHGEASPIIEVADLSIDTAARTVRRGQQTIRLTPREYAIVEMLALNRGKLVSRTMLYDHLFGEDDDTLSNLLDVHVFNLRKKLGGHVIVTRRGEGYLIES
jgi:two-component system, OmpR family, response regulator